MISIKTAQEVSTMREGGIRLARIVQDLQPLIRPGITTEELDVFAEAQILKAGAMPAFKGYQGFPKTLCTSVNEEVVHAVPLRSRILKEGDIITLDIGLIWPASGTSGSGFYLDMARTFCVGKVSMETMHLVKTTKKALRLGIKKARPGNTVGDIGNTIQRFVESQGYNVVRDLCGHGIGKALHEDPQILNYGERHTGPALKEGMVICIEPMVTVGDWHLEKSSDGFGYITKDRSLSCHFEDTLVITSSGSKVLTKSR